MLIYPLGNIKLSSNNCQFTGNEDNKKFIGKGEVEYSQDIFTRSEREAQKLAFLDYLAYSEGDISAIAETSAERAKNSGKKIIKDIAKKIKK